MTQPVASIQFKNGMKLEFHGDGDVCEVVGNFSIRGKYKIIYRSLKSGKKFCDTRATLISSISEGICIVK